MTNYRENLHHLIDSLNEILKMRSIDFRNRRVELIFHEWYNEGVFTFDCRIVYKEEEKMLTLFKTQYALPEEEYEHLRSPLQLHPSQKFFKQAYIEFLEFLIFFESSSYLVDTKANVRAMPSWAANITNFQ